MTSLTSLTSDFTPIEGTIRSQATVGYRSVPEEDGTIKSGNVSIEKKERGDGERNGKNLGNDLLMNTCKSPRYCGCELKMLVKFRQVASSASSSSAIS